jgi:putative endonuclease
MAMTARNRALGQWGETLAADYLARQGYAVLDRNVRTPYGEIDLLARKEDTLVFVEVKTRSGDAYGNPEASITPAKRQHLIAAAQAYLQAHPEIDLPWRIDVIAIRKRRTATPEIVHFEDAIS